MKTQFSFLGLFDKVFTAHVHILDPTWLDSYIASLPDAVNAAGTMAEPVDLEDSDGDPSNENDIDKDIVGDGGGDESEVEPSALGGNDESIARGASNGGKASHEKSENKSPGEEMLGKSSSINSLNVSAAAGMPAKAGFGGGSQEDAVVLQDSSDDSDSDELGGRVDNAV